MQSARVPCLSRTLARRKPWWLYQYFMQGSERMAKPLSGQAEGAYADTYETGTNDIGRAGHSVTEFGRS